MSDQYEVTIGGTVKAGRICSDCGRAFPSWRIPEHECTGPLFAPADIRRTLAMVTTKPTRGR